VKRKRWHDLKSFALLFAGDRECGRMRVRRELGLGTIEGGVELGDADRELIGYAFRADGYEVSINEEIRAGGRLVTTLHADEPRIVWGNC
jgi:hypothetical protein